MVEGLLSTCGLVRSCLDYLQDWLGEREDVAQREWVALGNFLFLRIDTARLHLAHLAARSGQGGPRPANRGADGRVLRSTHARARSFRPTRVRRASLPVYMAFCSSCPTDKRIPAKRLVRTPYSKYSSDIPAHIDFSVGTRNSSGLSNKQRGALDGEEWRGPLSLCEGGGGVSSRISSGSPSPVYHADLVYPVLGLLVGVSRPRAGSMSCQEYNS